MEKTSKYIMALAFIVISYFAVLVIKPFITALLASFILAYIFYPVFTKVDSVIQRKNISAFLVSLFLVLLITLPTIFLLNTVTKEVIVLYTIGEQRIISGNILGIDCDKNPWICNKLDFVKSNLRLRFYLEENLDKITSYLTNAITDFVFGIPHRILEIFITLFTTFFLFRDGKNIVRRIRSLIPLKESYEKPLLRRLNDITYAILYGNVVLAVVEGILGGFAFWIVGIASPVFWGILMGVLALLPIVGAGGVWVIATILLFLDGAIWQAAFLGSFCLIFVSGIDIFLKPKVIGDRANVHPLLILFGVLGGILIFNIIGLVIGPLILALFITFFEIYETEKIKDVVKHG